MLFVVLLSLSGSVVIIEWNATVLSSEPRQTFTAESSENGECKIVYVPEYRTEFYNDGVRKLNFHCSGFDAYKDL